MTGRETEKENNLKEYRQKLALCSELTGETNIDRTRKKWKV
jgi:hypothetical protein